MSILKLFLVWIVLYCPHTGFDLQVENLSSNLFEVLRSRILDEEDNKNLTISYRSVLCAKQT